MNKHYLIIAFFLLAATGAAQAQVAKDSIKILELKEIIVNQRRMVKKDSISKAFKQDAKLLEFPQNITTIDNNIMKMQGTFNLSDALRNVSGVFVQGSPVAGGIFGLGTVSIRGFQDISIRRNGMNAGTGIYGQEDEALIDDIEVVKGPAGFISNTGQPGGSINVNTKVPKAYDIREVTLTQGNFGFHRASVDYAAAIKKQGFSYRINAAYESQDLNDDILSKQKVVVAPVLQYNFSENSYILAEYNLINSSSENGSQYSFADTESTLFSSPWSANYMADIGLPLSSANDNQFRIYFEHKFNDRLKLTSQNAYSDIFSSRWLMVNYATMSGPIQFDENGNGARRFANFDNSVKSLSNQLFLNAHYRLSPLFDYRGLIGIDYSNSVSQTTQQVGANSLAIAKLDPQYGISATELDNVYGTLYTYYSRIMSVEPYLYNTLSYRDKLYLNLGGRFTYSDMTSYSYRTETDVFPFKGFKPRIGLSYLPIKSLNVFAVYDQVFQAQGRDQNGQPYLPLESYNKELGVKKEWLGSALSTTLSIFDIIRNNSLAPNGEGNYVQIGQVKSRGFEVDILGSISKNITVTSNYAFTSAYISANGEDPSLVGQRLASSPKHMLNTWLMYSANKGWLQGFSASLGQISAMDIPTSSTFSPTMPNYTKWDATLMYQQSKWYVRVFLDNLTNNRYINSALVTDRYAVNNGVAEIVGSNWSYQQSMPFSCRLQVGLTL